jgi:citrate lyase subunit beta/citryl-CoA lyase
MNSHVAASPVSYLFVPGNRPERFDKALDAGADVVIMDLEDAVAAEGKERARNEISQWCAAKKELASRIVVRINDAASEWFEADLNLLRTAGIRGAMLPKAEFVSQITRVTAAVEQACYVIPIIESARGLLNVDAIAAADGVQRLAFGTLDYAIDLDLSGDERGLLYPACRIALASKVAGLASPIAGVTVDLSNEDVLFADLAFARACGFGAKLCIHPKQVSAIHRALTPTADEVAWAKRVISAAQAGRGAVQVDGKMVDRPILLKARGILERQVD